MAGDFPQDYADRFGGMARLFGVTGLHKLRSAHVCVVGVGGVGSWTVEALVRAGIRHGAGVALAGREPAGHLP